MDDDKCRACGCHAEAAERVFRSESVALRKVTAERDALLAVLARAGVRMDPPIDAEEVYRTLLDWESAIDALGKVACLRCLIPTHTTVEHAEFAEMTGEDRMRRLADADRLHEENERLKAALYGIASELHELAVEGWGYAPEYFNEKWRGLDRAATLKQALDAAILEARTPQPKP